MFELLREIAPVAILLFNGAGELVATNRRWTHLTGQLEQDALGGGWSDVIDPELRPSFIGGFMEAVGMGQELRSRFKLRNPPHEKISGQLVFHMLPHRSQAGGLLGFVATLAEDIDSTSQASNSEVQASLLRAQEAIESAARTKIEFLGNISHEIRTPLNGIVGMTGLLIDTPLNDEQLEYTRILKGCTETLLNLINDLLDFSKLESSQVALQETRFHLTESIAGVLRLFDIHARSKNQEIVSLVERDVPDLLEGDVSRLKQILGNLLGNAIKFTLDGGGILLMSSKESSNKEFVTLHFAVADSGIGVPSELRQRIFDPFVQADGSLTREYPGVGLGLSISKRLVELLGGKIWCESIPGVGSTFHFTVRFKVIDSAPRTPFTEGTPLPSDLTALIVQPNRVALEHIEMILKKWNITARGVMDEDEALRHFENTDQGSRISVALIDMNLARTNGFELAAELHRRAPSLKVLMLLSTENYYEGLRLVKEIGLAGAILKPITHSNLLDALLSLYNSRDEGVEGADSAKTLLSRGWLAFDPKNAGERTEPSSEHRTSILVVEDNLASQKVVRGVLERRGFAVTVAWNGTEARAALRTLKFDLILMDTHLPHESGLDVIRSIRQDEAKRNNEHIPIISLTAQSLEGDREASMAAGADDYISKPFEPESLIQMIERLLVRR